MLCPCYYSHFSALLPSKIHNREDFLLFTFILAITLGNVLRTLYMMRKEVFLLMEILNSSIFFHPSILAWKTYWRAQLYEDNARHECLVFHICKGQLWGYERGKSYNAFYFSYGQKVIQCYYAWPSSTSLIEKPQPHSQKALCVQV